MTNGGKTYTFRVRSGMKFSNGVPITAKNYQAAINRDANPKMESPSLPFFQDIVGATDAGNTLADETKAQQQDRVQRDVAKDGRYRKRKPPLLDQSDRVLAEPHLRLRPVDGGLAY